MKRFVRRWWILLVAVVLLIIAAGTLWHAARSTPEPDMMIAVVESPDI